LGNNKALAQFIKCLIKQKGISTFEPIPPAYMTRLIQTQQSCLLKEYATVVQKSEPIPRYHQIAAELYQALAETGDAEAMIEFSKLLYNEISIKNIPLAISYAKKAIEIGATSFVLKFVKSLQEVKDYKNAADLLKGL
jgi:hypothetical protein